MRKSPAVPRADLDWQDKTPGGTRGQSEEKPLVQPKISTVNGNNNHNGHIAARPMNAAERDHLTWWLRVIRESTDSAPYLVTYRGLTFAASPQEAARVLGWGGRLEQTTYRPRNGNHH
jgi:hypothetical protein